MSIMVFRKQAPIPVEGDGASQATEFTWDQVTTGTGQARLSPLTVASGNDTLYAWCGLYLTQGGTYNIDVNMDVSSSLYSESGTKIADGEYYMDPETYNERNRISFECQASGLYGFRAEVSSGMEMSYIDVTMDTPPGQDTRQGSPQTSTGFDAIGLPIRYPSLLDAGIAKLTPDTIPGLILYAPMSVNGVQTTVGPTLSGNTTAATTVSGITGVLFDRADSRSGAFTDLSGLSACTITCWVNMGGWGAAPVLMHLGGSYGFSLMEVKLSASDDGFKLWAQAASSAGSVISDFPRFPGGSWHFCAIALDKNSVLLRQDAQVQSGNFSQVVVLGGSYICIGASSEAQNQCDFYLSKVRIYNRALSADELSLLAGELTPTA